MIRLKILTILLLVNTLNLSCKNKSLNENKKNITSIEEKSLLNQDIDKNRDSKLDVKITDIDFSDKTKVSQTVSFLLNDDNKNENIFLENFKKMSADDQNKIYVTQTNLIEFNEEKQLYDLKSGLLIEKGCYSYLIDYEKGFFFINSTLESLEVPLLLSGRELVEIFSAGNLCLDSNSRLKSFDNDCLFSTPEESTKNFIFLLSEYNIVPKSEGGMNLTAVGLKSLLVDYFGKKKGWVDSDHLNTNMRTFSADYHQKGYKISTKMNKKMKIDGYKYYAGSFQTHSKINLSSSRDFNFIAGGNFTTYKKSGVFGRTAVLKEDVLKYMEFVTRRRNADAFQNLPDIMKFSDIDLPDFYKSSQLETLLIPQSKLKGIQDGQITLKGGFNPSESIVIPPIKLGDPVLLIRYKT